MLQIEHSEVVLASSNGVTRFCDDSDDDFCGEFERGHATDHGLYRVSLGQKCADLLL